MAGGRAIKRSGSRAPHVLSARLTSTRDWLGQLNYMKKVSPFQGSRSSPGQPARSWSEWKSEFESNARLCDLDPQEYYNMSQTMLSSTVRDQWMSIIKDKPHLSNWAAMDSHFRSIYAVRDRKAGAEEKLNSTQLQKDTEPAWQSYVASMTKHITDMGDVDSTNTSERGKWNKFMGNTCTFPLVQSQIYSHVGQQAEEY